MPEIPRDYRTRGDGLDVVAEMEEELVDYTARVTHAATAADVPATTAEALPDAAGITVPPGLGPVQAEVAGKGREIHVGEPSLTSTELDRIDAVVAALHVAVALSGTTMLDGAPDMDGRAISLVPDTRMMVLKAPGIKATVPEAVTMLDENPVHPTT